MSDMSVSNATMIPVSNKYGEVVGWEDEVNGKSMPIPQEKAPKPAEVSPELPKLTAEDIAGMALCVGSLGILCAAGCSLGKPSSEIAEKAIRELIINNKGTAGTLTFNTPHSLGGDHFSCMINVEIEECEVREIGVKQTATNSRSTVEYWPVKAYIKASGIGFYAVGFCIKPLEEGDISKGKSAKIDGLFEFNIYKDRYGNWVADR